MQTRSTRSCRSPVPALLILLVLCRLGLSQTTNQWTNTVSGAWGNGANWSANQPPSSGFTYTMISNAGSKTVTIDSSASGGSLSIDRLRISAPSGSTNTLLLFNMTTGKPLQASSTVELNQGGVLALTNSALTSAGLLLDRGAALNVTNSTVTQSGALTTFDVVNGTAWLESGLLDCGSIQAIRLGRTNNATGNLVVHGGNVLADLIEVGTTTASAPGTLGVSGGTVNASGVITVGYGVNSTGTVAVTAGQLIATNDITYVGKSGFGQMTVSGGNATFAFLSVGNNADGLLTVSGGQLTLRPRTTNDWLQIGNIGNGQFTMTGGTVLSGGEVHVGDDSSGFFTGSGVANITGGLLIATNDQTAIGRYGPGQMTISNATVVLTNVSVGRHDGATGTLTIQNNAQAYLLDALSIGRFSNSVGHVFVTGGLLSLTNDSIWIGREGTGEMTLSGGTVRADAAFVALSTVVIDPNTLLPVTNVPSGTLTISGGSMVLTSNLLVGTSLISTGNVAVLGGNLAVTGAGTPAYIAVSSGNFALSQGTVTTDNLYLTNNTGHFVFNGGTLQAKAAVVANGLPFLVGDGTHTATLQLLGGTYSFANGLVISSNATVTGCGTFPAQWDPKLGIHVT